MLGNLRINARKGLRPTRHKVLRPTRPTCFGKADRMESAWRSVNLVICDVCDVGRRIRNRRRYDVCGIFGPSRISGQEWSPMGYMGFLSCYVRQDKNELGKKAFQILCHYLRMIPIAPKFLHFYQMRPGAKI
ncbi:hypothetical protein CR513_09197, partial [Mucuna pruriens]